MKPPYRQIGYGILITGGLIAAVNYVSHRRDAILQQTPTQQVTQIADERLENFRYISRFFNGKGYKAINFIDTKTGKRVTGYSELTQIVLETDADNIGNVTYFNKFGSPELEEVIIGKNDGTIERIKHGNNEFGSYDAEYSRLIQAAVEVAIASDKTQ